MIHSFRDKWLADFYWNDESSKKVPADIEGALFRRLNMLQAATCDRDLRSPPSNHFEQMKGNLAGKCSIRVNKKWRLVFAFDGSTGQATDVYLDPHTY